MKSDFQVPRTLPKEKPEPSIKLDADKLLGLLLRAEIMMNKVDRVRYCTRAINLVEDIIAEFSLAYDFEDEGVTKWKNSVMKPRNKGTTRATGRNGQTPEE